MPNDPRQVARFSDEVSQDWWEIVSCYKFERQLTKAHVSRLIFEMVWTWKLRKCKTEFGCGKGVHGYEGVGTELTGVVVDTLKRVVGKWES